MTVVVMASGQSLTAQDVEYVKIAREENRVKAVIAVSNVGLDLAPWADALVSHDTKWWAMNINATQFSGRRFCRSHWPNVEAYVPNPKGGCNSGYMAMQVARDIYKADKIILLGFDMHGTHYFGKHPTGLRNTTNERFLAHIGQFNSWVGPEVINCTPNSALKKFPFMELEKAI